MVDGEYASLSAIAKGTGELATLARGTLAEMRRRASYLLADGEATMDIFHAAWERFTVKFDRTRGVAPSTYMHFCIRYAIKRYCQCRSQYKSLPMSDVFRDECDHDVISELALEKRGCICARRAPVDESAVEAAVANAEARDNMDDALRYLSERTARCIRLRYYHDLTLREIGELEGLSHERVRQIIAAGLKRLRYRYIQGEEVDECNQSNSFVSSARNAVERAARS